MRGATVAVAGLTGFAVVWTAAGGDMVDNWAALGREEPGIESTSPPSRRIGTTGSSLGRHRGNKRQHLG